MKTPLLSEGLSTLVIIGLLLTIGLFIVEGCANDSKVDRELKERQDRIERMETEKDSIDVLRREAADSLAVWKEKKENSDAARRMAERRTAVAYAALKRLPTYENLTHDALALRADSLYRALADG